MDLNEIGCESMDWINVAHNTDWWWALVNMTAKLGLHKR
jgi:hypothetical protein